MSNLNVCIAFAASQWGAFPDVESLLEAVSAAGDDVAPGGPLNLTASESAVLQRAIQTAGETVALDVERIGAETAGLTHLKIYDHEGLIVDADTLIERGINLATCAEVVMVENQWIPVSFIRENVDAEVFAPLAGLYWPGTLMQIQVYKLLHRAIKGDVISFAALKQAADQAANAGDDLMTVEA